VREGIIKNRLNHKGLMNLRTNRKIGDRAFSVAALRALESAADRLETLAFRSTASFKSKLKSFLFHAAYTGNIMPLPV